MRSLEGGHNNEAENKQDNLARTSRTLLDDTTLHYAIMYILSTA